MFFQDSLINFSNKKFRSHLLILSILLLVTVLFYFICPDSFFIITKTLIPCLSFYLVISSFYTQHMCKYPLFPTFSLFYGLINLFQLIQVIGIDLFGMTLSPLFYSIKIYYVGRISFAIIVVCISYTYVSKRDKFFKMVNWLLCFVMVFFIASFFIFNEGFITFTKHYSLASLYFNLANHLIIPLALSFGFFQLYKIKDELPEIQKKIFILFLACSSMMECIDILYFTPLAAPPIFSALFQLFTLSLLVLGQIDTSIFRPFQELQLKEQKIAQLINENTASVAHYSEHIERLEAILHSQATQYQKLISILPEPSIICTDSIIYQVNSAAIKLFQVSSPHELVGTNILSYIKDAPELHAHYGSLLFHQGTILKGEGTLVLPNRETYNIEYVFTPNALYTTNTIICILRDVTSKYETQTAQKELFRQQLKLRYFSSISHDIKTPINIIYSALQMQSKSATLAECTHYTKMMQNSCLKLLKLLNNLLDLTKIDNKMLSISPQIFNIVDAVESLCEISSYYMSTKEISYIFDTDVDEKLVSLDPNLMERIILNLLSNAVKYTPNKGHISVCIHDYDSYITIHVQDTGIGIPEEKIDFIFDRYTVLGQNYGGREHSAGMGLSIVGDLLHLMDATITCQSTVGIGSEFIIKLPTPQCTQAIIDEPYSVNYSPQNIKIEFCDI